MTAGSKGAGELRFDDHGRFKVMVISDIQDGRDVCPYTLRLLDLALQRETPDLVVLNGDNIFGWAPTLLARP